MEQKDYWDSFYKDFKVQEPSDFAKWVSRQEFLKNSVLIDWGCGSGRDGLFLAHCMKKIILIDSSESAISLVLSRIAKEEISNAQALISNSNEFRAPVNPGSDQLVNYGRFFLHAIDDSDLELFLKSISDFPSELNKVYSVFEYRVEDSKKNLHFTYGSHNRWLRKSSQVATWMEKNGWEMQFDETSRDFAVFENETPLVVRQVFKK